MERGARQFHRRRSLACALTALVLGLSPTIAAAQAPTVNDPFEGANRRLYSVHKVIDKVVLRPVMVAYLVVFPSPLRSGLSNAVGNLSEPITFVNDVLQVRPKAAGRTLTRFATNSTIGLGGLFNPAEKAGFPRHYSDFGQTLGRYGVGPGPYIFVPGLGPSTLRDLSGRFADVALDPVNYVRYDGDLAVRIIRPTVFALETRAFFDTEIRELDRTATDPYVTLRSAYLQSRASMVRRGEVDVEALPSFDTEAPAMEPTAPVSPGQ